jgi:hypothetical protein
MASVGVAKSQVLEGLRLAFSALVGGTTDAEVPRAEPARGKLRSKLPALRQGVNLTLARPSCPF